MRSRIIIFFKALLVSSFFLATAASGQTVTDLTLNLAATPTSNPASFEFATTFTIDNATSVTANGAQLVVSFPQIPSGGSVEFTDFPAPACSELSGQLRCDLGAISGSSQRTVDIRYRLKDAVGPWDIHGEVTTSTPENNINNNAHGTSLITSDSSDIVLTAAGPLTEITAGESFAYALTIRNDGPSNTAAGGSTVVTFTVPDNIRFTGAPGWACSPSPADAGALVSCTNTAAITAGGSKNMTINAIAMSGSSSAIDISFSAKQLQSSGNDWPDPYMSNNTAIVSVLISPGSDVGIRKTVATNDSDQLIYTITPRFEAGDPIDNTIITMTDRYGNDQFTFVDWVSDPADNGWTCSGPAPDGTNMVITCTRPGFDGANFSDIPGLQFTAAHKNNISATNLASIALTGRNDPVTANNDSSILIDTSGHADLATSKTVIFGDNGPEVAAVGQTFKYRITARNNGPWRIPAGQTITIADVLPNNYALEKAPEFEPANSYWSCTVTQGGTLVAGYPVTSTTAAPVTVTCTSVAGLSVSATTPAIVLTGHVTAGSDSFSNTACVVLADRGTPPTTGWRIDNNSNNNCAGGHIRVTDEIADLVVKKTVNPDPIDAGQPLTYTITVTNNGPDAATDVMITDALTSLLNSGGLQSLTMTAPDTSDACTVDGHPPALPMNGTSHTIQCSVSSLGNGETATIIMTVLPVIATTGPRTNSVSAYSSEVGDPDRESNIASATSTVKAVYDLTVETWATSSGTSAVTTAPANSALSFTTRVRSLGPSSAPNAHVVITLPTNARLLRLNSVGGATCTPTESDLVGTTGGTLTCDWNTAIAAAAYRDITYQVMVPNTVGATITSSAAVSLVAPITQQETNLTNNTARANVTVTTANADVQVTLVEHPDPVPLGSDVAYTIIVRNNGLSLATDVKLDVLIEKLTAAYSYQGNLIVDQGGVCQIEPLIGDLEGNIVCGWDELAVSEFSTITYIMRAESVVLPHQSGTIRTTATVSATEEDSVPNNNVAIKSSTARRAGLITPGADLAITKTASTSNVSPGVAFDYTLTVINNGPLDVTVDQGAQIVDVLPAGIALVSTPAGCSYDNAARTLTCLILGLANGAQFSVTVPVKTTVGGGAAVRNTAIVDMPEDIDLSNNESSVTITSGTHTIPTLSPWSLATLMLLMLFTATLYARNRRHG